MEETSQFSPENSGGQFSFKVGEEGFGFDGGFTDGRFAGVIRGTDGKEFTGLVEDLGDGRYRIEDWDGDRIIEPAAEAAAEVPATAAEMPVGLEEAAAAVAMEAAAQPEPAPVVIPAAGVVEQPAEEAAAPAEAVAPASVKELRLAHMPEPAESSEASSIHPAIKNTIDRLQEIRREVAPQAEESKRLLAVEAEAKNLRQKAEKARESVKKLKKSPKNGH